MCAPVSWCPARSAASRTSAGAALRRPRPVRRWRAEAVEGIARNRKLAARIASKVGKVAWAVIEGLIPDPLDAIEC